MDHFWAPKSILEFFTESVYWIFLKLYLMTGFKKWFKIPVSDLKEDSYYAQNEVNGVFFGPEIIIFELFFRSAHFVPRFYHMEGIKKS